MCIKVELKMLDADGKQVNKVTTYTNVRNLEKFR